VQIAVESRPIEVRRQEALARHRNAVARRGGEHERLVADIDEALGSGKGDDARAERFATRENREERCLGHWYDDASREAQYHGSDRVGERGWIVERVRNDNAIGRVSGSAGERVLSGRANDNPMSGPAEGSSEGECRTVFSVGDHDGPAQPAAPLSV
jgi:hypothetical protein